MKYTVILFKNKERKKLLKSFKTLNNAKNFFKKLKDKSDLIIFNKEIENGITSNFEIGLIDNNPSEFDNYFVKDNLGRQVKVQTEESGVKIIEISKYNVEEFIYDVSKNKRISFFDFYKTYISSTEVKLISKINNKFFTQQDDEINLFSLKSDSDCFRFFSILENYLIDKKKTNCILVRDSSSQQKKYIYSFLESKGFSKKSLYRHSTTFFKENF